MNIFDRISERWYRFRVRRLLRARGDLPGWFVAFALVVQVAQLSACAAWQARRATRRIDATCAAAYDRATTEAEVRAVHQRCEAAYEEVRTDGR